MGRMCIGLEKRAPPPTRFWVHAILSSAHIRIKPANCQLDTIYQSTRRNITEHLCTSYTYSICDICRSQWSRGLRRRSAASRLLRLWVRILPGGMDVCCECCVLSGRGLCDGLITRPEESYRLWRVVVCDQEIS